MRKGFTLIELLAVIVILAIIAVIATPIVLDIINDAKISSVKSSMNNIEKALELYYYTNKSNNEIVFNCEDGVCKTGDGDKLNVSGQLPSKGIMTISKKGKVTYDSVVLSGYMCDKINDEFTCSLASKNIVSSENKSIIIKDNTTTTLNNYRIYGNSVEEKKNLLDDKISLTNGMYLDKQGNEMTNGAWLITDFIEVTGYSFNLKNVGGNAASICAYDENKNFVTGVNYNTTNSTVKTNVSISSATLIKYVRFSVFNSWNMSDIQLTHNISTQIHTPDVPNELKSVGDKTTNLFNYVGRVIGSRNGLTNTLNSDGTITSVGIPTSNYTHIVTYKNITDLLEDGETYILSQKLYKLPIYAQVIAKNISTGTENYYTCEHRATTFKVNKSTYTYSIVIQTGTTSSWGSESRTITNGYQLEKGDTATEFEPYGKYKISVKARGKNLTDWRNVKRIVNGITLESDDNGIVTINGIPTNPSGSVIAYMNPVEIGLLKIGQKYKTNLACYIVMKDETEKYVKEFIFTEDMKNIQVYIHRKLDDYIDGEVFKPYLYEYSDDDEYEPYKEEIVNIYLDEPLRKVGTYVDYIDFKSNKLVRNVGVLTLTGEESWKEKDGIFYLEESIGVSSDKEISISTHFAYKEESDFWIDDNNRINIKQEVVNTLEEFKEWLKNNNVTIHYPLKKSIVKEIELPKINLNEKYSYLSVDTTVKPGKILLEYN